jgi:hypothetical protein
MEQVAHIEQPIQIGGPQPSKSNFLVFGPSLSGRSSPGAPRLTSADGSQMGTPVGMFPENWNRIDIGRRDTMTPGFAVI